MTWPELLKAPPPLSMTGLLTFMERWKPESTHGFEPATADQIAVLAQPHGGLEALPRVYREFLATMGASTGSLKLVWGTTSISALLEDREDRQRERPDPRRYLKFAIGEDDYNGRHPDDFFDLARPTPDGRDAAIIRIHERHLVSGKVAAEQPFPTFSDLLRSGHRGQGRLEGRPAAEAAVLRPWTGSPNSGQGLRTLHTHGILAHRAWGLARKSSRLSTWSAARSP